MSGGHLLQAFSGRCAISDTKDDAMRAAAIGRMRTGTVVAWTADDTV